MLVALFALAHRRHVHAALVGERAPADVGCVVVRRQVGDLGHAVCELGQLPQRAFGQAGEAELELEVGEERAEVRVAAALAVAVDRALHVSRAGAHGRERVGDGAAPIVVGVDAEDAVDSAHHLARGLFDLPR